MKKKILTVFALFALILSTGCANANTEQSQASVPDASGVQSSTQGVESEITIQDRNGKYSVELTLPEGFELTKSTPLLACVKMSGNISGVISIMENLGENVDIERLNNTAEEHKADLYSDGIEEMTVNDYTVKYIIYRSDEKVRVDGVIFVNDDIMLSVLITNQNDNEQETRQSIESLIKCISDIKSV